MNNIHINITTYSIRENIISLKNRTVVTEKNTVFHDRGADFPFSRRDISAPFFSQE